MRAVKSPINEFPYLTTSEIYKSHIYNSMIDTTPVYEDSYA